MIKKVIIVLTLISGAIGYISYLKRRTCDPSTSDFVKEAEMFYNSCMLNKLNNIENAQPICESLTILYLMRLNEQYKRNEASCIAVKKRLKF